MSLKKQKLQQEAKKQNKLDSDTFSSILAFGIVGGIILLCFIVGWAGTFINGIKYGNIIKQGDHIDVENDRVVLTYPSALFPTDEDRDALVKNLKEKDGVMKVVVTDDGSISTLMNMERYEKIKESALVSAQSMIFTGMSDTSAVQNAEYNDEYTHFTLYINREVDTLEEEIESILAMAKLYHICNMDSGAVITIDLADYTTNEVYLTTVYDINGNVIE